MLDFEANPRLNVKAMDKKPALDLKRAVSYLRVSTRGQAERDGEKDGYSIPAQQEANKQKALSMGAVVIKEFADRGASAKYANRQGLKDLLEYIQDPENNVSYVIVHKIDRLARNREDDIHINKVFAESGVRLVSTSEPIDESPSGQLMHAMLAGFAEFYSNNLAQEAIKGMSQKVKKGGTVSKAPIGYKNIKYVNSDGQEVRTVEIDKERAPFITKAFEMYSTGKWSVCNLAIELSERGLTTAPTPRKPSIPIGENSLSKVLQNPYYLGKVKFQGIYHDGKHEKLTNEITFRKVQAEMKNHQNGERKRVNNHYLKSTVWCGECGSRLIIQVTKSRSGTYYPYFVCNGKASKRTKCKQKAVLIYEVEDQIAEYYKTLEFSEEFTKQLKERMLRDIAEQKKQSAKERDDFRKEQERIKNRQKKLLETYYDNLIAKELFQEAQADLAAQLMNVEARLAVAEEEYEVVEKHLSDALELIGNCYKAYKDAPDGVRRQFNQAFFEKIYVSPNKTDGTKVVITADPNEPFSTLLKQNNHRHNENGIRSFYDNGYSQLNMVELQGFEPWTSSMPSKRSNQLSYNPRLPILP